MVWDEASSADGTPVGAQRLGKNQGRYLGEQINIQSILDEIQELASQHGWQQDCFLRREDYCLLAYHLGAPEAHRRLYLSTGIHGDEPAGPLAVRDLMREHRWPTGVDVWRFYASVGANTRSADPQLREQPLPHRGRRAR